MERDDPNKDGKVLYQLENPEMGAARLAVLEEMIGPGVFVGTGHGASGTVAMSDKMGDALATARVECQPEVSKMLIGHKSEFALRQLATPPHTLSLTAIRDVRATRQLWRQKGASVPLKTLPAHGVKGVGGKSRASAPAPKGLDIVIKSRTELQMELLSSDRKLSLSAASLSAAFKAEETTGAPARQHACFSHRELGSQKSTCKPNVRCAGGGGSATSPAVSSVVAVRREQKRQQLERMRSELKGRRELKSGSNDVSQNLSSASGSRIAPRKCARNSCIDEAHAAGGQTDRPGRLHTMNKQSAAMESRSCMDRMARRDNARAGGSTPRNAPVHGVVSEDKESEHLDLAA